MGSAAGDDRPQVRSAGVRNRRERRSVAQWALNRRAGSESDDHGFITITADSRACRPSIDDLDPSVPVLSNKSAGKATATESDFVHPRFGRGVTPGALSRSVRGTAKTMRPGRNGRVFLLTRCSTTRNGRPRSMMSISGCAKSIQVHLRDFIMFACGTTPHRTTAEESLAEPAVAKFSRLISIWAICGVAFWNRLRRNMWEPACLSCGLRLRTCP